MNKNDLVMLMMAKRTLDYQKDPNPENWRTIKGAKVHIDENGKIDGGAGGKFNGKGALPRSMFSESGKAKQTEFAEVTEKKKEIAEREQKLKETQKAERRKQRVAARKQQKAEKEEKQRKEREGWYWEDKPEKAQAKPAAKKETKTPEVGDKGMAFLKRMSVIHSSFDESTGYMARDVAQQLKEGKSLQEIKDYFYGNIEKWGSNKEEERKEVDHFIEAVKRADKGLDPWKRETKLDSPKAQKKKIDPASTEAQAKRQAIADDMMKRPFVKSKVEEASKKLIAEANKDYGGDHETSVMLENVVKDKDGAYVTLKIVAKDKTGKSRFPQSHSMTFKVGDLTKEQKKLYFGKGETKTQAKEPKKSASKSVAFKKPSYELAKQISDLSNGIVYTGEKSDDPNKPYVVHHPKWGKITTATHPEEMLKKLKQMKEDNERRKKEPKGEELPW